MRKAIDLLIGLAVLPMLLHAAPRVYYTDLDRGPAVPTNGGRGAFITIYGTRFGNSRITSRPRNGVPAQISFVTIDGIEPDSYLSWTNTKIVVRLGQLNQPGNNLPIVVTVNGVQSNPDVTFSIDNGRAIYYFDPKVDGSATDTCSNPSNGSEETPWRYLRQTLALRDVSYFVNTCMSNGDILYLRSGTIDTRDGSGWQHSILIFDLVKKNVSWMAVVGYPGESVTLDGSKDPDIREALTTKGYATGLIVAGLTLIGGTQNVLPSMPAGRIVGNIVTGPTSCLYEAIGVTSNNGGVVLGNEITAVGNSCNGEAGPTKLMHSLYMKCNNCEVGWNTIHGNKTYNGVQFHDDTLIGLGGYYNISIHDNWIEGQYGSGINLSTIDFPTGTEYVRVYNNVLYSEGVVARAYNESAGGQIKSCVALKDMGKTSATGTIEVYNNTMAACTELFNDTAWGNTPGSGALYKGGMQAGVTLAWTNNLVYAPPYYWTDPARGSRQLNAFSAITTLQCCAAQIGGSNNLWFGVASAPNYVFTGLSANPMFMNLVSLDFHPQDDSPALKSGISVSWIQTDRDGNPRSSTPSIGAYERIGPRF
jgi:hypothetical protein